MLFGTPALGHNSPGGIPNIPIPNSNPGTLPEAEPEPEPAWFSWVLKLSKPKKFEVQDLCLGSPLKTERVLWVLAIQFAPLSNHG